jgi:hypothetical protein
MGVVTGASTQPPKVILREPCFTTTSLAHAPSRMLRNLLAVLSYSRCPTSMTTKTQG